MVSPPSFREEDMGNLKPLVKETPWFRVEADPWGVFPSVKVLGRWAYHWVTVPGVDPWSEPEKRFFHAIVQGLVKSGFANARLNITAKKINFSTSFKLEFDIGWALERYKHWTVYVTKLPPGSHPLTLVSHVDGVNRVVRLDTADLMNYHVCNAAGNCNVFNAIPHELVHTWGHNPDEAVPGSPHLRDTKSVLNIGNQLRNRHMHLILKCLEELVPDARFSLA